MPIQKSPYFLPSIFAVVLIIGIGATALVMSQSKKESESKNSNSSSSSISKSEDKLESKSSSTNSSIKIEPTNNKTVEIKQANKFSFVLYEEKEALFVDGNGDPIKCGIDGIKVYTPLEVDPQDRQTSLHITSKDLAIKNNAVESLEQVDLVLNKQWFKEQMPLTKAKYSEIIANIDIKKSLANAFRTTDCTGEFLDAPVKYLNSISYAGMDKSQALLTTGGQGEFVSLQVFVYAKKGNEYLRIVEVIPYEVAFTKGDKDLCNAKAEGEIEKCYVDLANKDGRINKMAEDTANKLINLYEII